MQVVGPGMFRFDSEQELASWYAQALTEGSVVLTDLPENWPGTERDLSLFVADGRRFSAGARIHSGRVRDDPPSYRALLYASPALRALLEAVSLERRQGRLAGAASGQRQHPRYHTFLKVRLSSGRQLLLEHATNISRAGMFVRTANGPPVGTEATLTVTLPNHEAHDIAVRVVRTVSTQEAEEKGLVAGVGVVFTQTPPAFVMAVEALLDEYQQRTPHVLVVDDDPFFVELVRDTLQSAGLRVSAAPGGFRAMRMLVDLLFDVDALVIDLRMPGLDGVSLIERLRRMQPTVDLRIIVFSAVRPEDLALVAVPGGADFVVRKNEGPDVLLEKVHQALRRAP